MFTASFKALPTREKFRGPGNISGNNVNMWTDQCFVVLFMEKLSNIHINIFFNIVLLSKNSLY